MRWRICLAVANQPAPNLLPNTPPSGHESDPAKQYSVENWHNSGSINHGCTIKTAKPPMAHWHNPSPTDPIVSTVVWKTGQVERRANSLISRAAMKLNRQRIAESRSHVLCLLGLIIIFFGVQHFLFGERFENGFEVLLNPDGNNSITWTPYIPERYFVYIKYDISSSRQAMLEKFMNSQKATPLKWDAKLSVMQGNELLLQLNELSPAPAILSGAQLYFMVGEFDLKRPSHLEISLLSRGSQPMAGMTPWLAVRPNELYRKSRYAHQLFWSFWGVICFPVGVGLCWPYLKRLVSR